MPALPARRQGVADRVVLAMSGSALAGLLLSLTNHWLLFGILIWLMLVLALALGYGPHSKRRTIAAALAVIFLIYTGLLLGIAWTDHPDRPLVLLLGLPLPTALFVYGIWPLGVLPGLLYAFEFRRSVLPEDKLVRFLAEHGRKD